MITLGITGRSGCGKSTVTACFREKGIPITDADQLSREILLPGSPVLNRLAERFGPDILDEHGALRRRLLADRAFATPEGKAALDAMTHPEIVRRIQQEKQKQRSLRRLHRSQEKAESSAAEHRRRKGQTPRARKARRP